jgi:putative ABC transport system permease protein
VGKILLIGRLVGRDLRYRPSQAVLLLLAICAATTVLSLALDLHGVTNKPYQQTRAETRGPDVVAAFGPLASAGPRTPGPLVRRLRQRLRAAQAQPRAEEKALMNAPGVAGHSGPYPVASVIVRLGKVAAPVEAEGRSEAAASVDQPKLITGSWVRPDGIVLERTFAEAIGARVGDRVSLDGRAYTVVGIAVTAASAPYPNLCFPPGGNCIFDLPTTCNGTVCSAGGIGGIPDNASPGLGWVTESDARALASSSAPLTYLLNLKLKDPATAPAFVAAHSNANPGPGSGGLVSWQSIAYNDGLLVQDEQQVLTPGAWLAGLLAVACVAVLAGGRMADQNRRVGLLKAVGGTPGLVGVVLMAENLVLALLAAGVGLLAGWLAAPLITSPGAALVGAPGAPAMTVATAAEVVGVALVVALVATLAPAIRGARTSTVRALANAARPPRRRGLLIAISRRLPVPLLLGVRLVARRPRRALLGAASVAVTMTGIVAVLTFHATADQRLGGSSALTNPVVTRDEQMLVVLTVALVALAVLNAIIAAWATVLDTAGAAALARALGATRSQLTGAIAVAQLLPAIPGAIVGVPLGLGLFVAASGSGAAGTTIPSVGWLVPAVLGTLIVVTGLTSIPAWAGARRPVTDVLAQEV